MIQIATFIEALPGSLLSRWADQSPWELVTHSSERVRELLTTLDPRDYRIEGDIAVHRSAIVEPGAVLKGPLIIDAHCFVATGAYLRGGCWVDKHCIIGPGAELKSSFMFSGSKLAHFNFVGDSVLGTGVNLEAGSIVCNYRNERADKEIKIRVDAQLLPIGCDKFGALIGDGSRLGANAVLAPGALLLPGSIIRRGALFDAEFDE
jgi:bifunctional N-acetylglucosamine-1-phosphate-uridyltransferase/glucosamine-1-phosphate-acetyltransferase GlmU-like protein